MKLIYTVAFSLLALAAFTSCGGKGQTNSQDSITGDSILVIDSGDYSSVIFKSSEDVINFLDFKKFMSPDGYIAFHGMGGVTDGEGFSITEVKLTDDKNAVLSIKIPKADLSGRLLLKVEDSDASILDEEAKTTYRIQPLTIKK
ncbi:MAG: hypothetical protein HDS03_06535 [Bacteroides sp.]|nr:hypothetical protein [Bacteroides sp.]